jgi:predicted small lipoprotein YifL
MKKRIFTVVLSVTTVLTLALAGCGNKVPADSSAVTKNSNSKPILLRVGYILSTGSDADKGAQ